MKNLFLDVPRCRCWINSSLLPFFCILHSSQEVKSRHIIVLSFLDPINETTEILVRRSPFFSTRHGLGSKIQHSSLVALITQQKLHLFRDLSTSDNPTFVFVQAQPDSPVLSNVALIEKLVSKVRPAQERDSVTDTLHCRVPTTMAQETSHRRVG